MTFREVLKRVKIMNDDSIFCSKTVSDVLNAIVF